MGRGEAKKVCKCAGAIHHAEKPNDNVADDDVKHEVAYTKTGMLIAKQINFFAEPFQLISTPEKTVIAIITFLIDNVYE